MKQETRKCQNCKNDFTIEPDDFSFYEKIKVPPPTWCPECRMKRRMAFRNERKLFRREDFLTGEKILSIIPPESGHITTKEKDWWSQEKWDALDYGVDFDPSKPFLAQLFELFKKVPKYQSAATRMINSEYSGNAANLKNCYLCFNSNFSEDCAYGNGVDYSKNCYDLSHVQKSERCYDSFWLTNCYDASFSSQCDECVSVWFSKNCRGCTNCFGCVNLVNKSNCFFNIELSKEEYEKKLKEMHLDSWSNIKEIKEKVKNFWLKFPNKYIQGVQNAEVYGEYITHSKNVKNSYLVREGKDLRYVQYSQTPSVQDSMDTTLTGFNSELLYEDAICGWGGTRFKFCVECWDGGRDFEYCLYCGRLPTDLFGCVGITKKQQYCILNKQYSKEEFYTLRKKIIKHMDEMPYIDNKGRVYKYGEFFPPEFSPFAYNQTIISEHFQSNKEEAEKFGMRWQESVSSEYPITILAKDLPDSIYDVSDEIVKEVIECEHCKRAYRVILSEFNFLKILGISLPHLCVDCRHDARIALRNKSKIYTRTCMCRGMTSEKNIYKNTIEHFHKEENCPNTFLTSYSSDRADIVYCEKCYQQEVY
jgi:hypothetical protein